MPSKNTWDKHWLEVAKTFSKLSKDPSTKVGAVLVTPDNRQCSGGYNGFACGMNDSDYTLWERPIKYQRSIHAEMNAIMNCPFDTKGCSIYITISPCHICLQHLVNAGINKVVYSEMYANAQYPEIWNEAASLIGEVYMLSDGIRKYYNSE
jgi:dCMP deaminase